MHIHYDVIIIIQDSKFWPGLGGSDSDYALVLVAYPLLETISSPFAGIILHWFSFTIAIIAFHIILIIGGIVYGLAGNIWMVFVGFGLFGAGASFGAITVVTYIGEMGTVMDNIRQKQGKKSRKFVLYILYSFVLNGGYLLCYGM